MVRVGVTVRVAVQVRVRVKVGVKVSVSLNEPQAVPAQSNPPNRIPATAPSALPNPVRHERLYIMGLE